MQQEQTGERRHASDRRVGSDRRSWECQLDFPYVDSHGTLVTSDRRQIVERRIDFAEYIDGDRRKGYVSRSAN